MTAKLYTIRPLKWTKYFTGSGDYWYAWGQGNTTYKVRQTASGDLKWSHDGTHEQCDSFNHGQQLCQADFERRMCEGLVEYCESTISLPAGYDTTGTLTTD